MKKAIILVIIVGALVGLYFANQRSTEVKMPEENGTEETSFRPNPSNATFQFDDGPITLSRGRNVREISQGSLLTEETSLTDHIAYGDLNNDNRDDAVVLLMRQGSGSGLFIYVAGFVSGTGAYRGTNAVFIGDRISPTSLSVTNGIITVTYLDRDPNEPYAAEPTISTTKRYALESGILVER
jgi:hypothetical protein